MIEPAPLARSTLPGFREEAVEQATLSWFELIGWRTVPGDYLAPDGPMGARTSYRQVVLEPERRGALATLNPDAMPTMVDAAVRTVLATPSQDLVEKNRVFHTPLASGVPVEVNQGGETRTVGLRLLEALRTLAQLLTRTIRGSMSIDWTRKESVRANMRIEVCKLLARYGCPPDLQKAAVDLVVQQAEALAAEWG